MVKEITASEKCRRTKLSKKTNSDLIDIIIRKDDVERRKDSLIVCLKNNIAGLEKKIQNINNDKKMVENEAVTLRQQLNFNAKTLRDNKVDLENASEQADRYKLLYENTLDKCSRAVKTCIALCVILAMAIATFIVLLV